MSAKKVDIREQIGRADCEPTMNKYNITLKSYRAIDDRWVSDRVFQLVSHSCLVLKLCFSLFVALTQLAPVQRWIYFVLPLLLPHIRMFETVIMVFAF